MRRLQALNLGQRIVLVIALAGALRTVGTYTVNRRGGDGWSAYVPLTERAYHSVGDPGWHPVAAALLWLALITLWAAVSVWLLGGPRQDPAGAPVPEKGPPG